MSLKIAFIFTVIIICVNISSLDGYFNKDVFKNNIRRDLKEKCPRVKAMRNLELNDLMGPWNIVQYYASSEEAPEYSCMKCVLLMSVEDAHITMNFTYIYNDDPLRNVLQGNITWDIPNFSMPEHWIHSEDSYEGIYNTYILDTDYRTWALIMHCAEKAKSPRYLSALLLSREPVLGVNVINFLREKLPRYDIDLSFMFPIKHERCDSPNTNLRESFEN